jgi:uncharacterized protein YndB with AHSA1/START domain
MDTILATNTLRLVRTFDAPRERVFKAWTDARQFMVWMCPPGCGIDECVLEAKVGGTWRAKGYAPGRRFAKSGVYLEVRRPELLVFTWAHHQDENDWASLRGHETTIRVEFRAVGNKTELTLTQGPFIDAPNFNGHNEGWKGSFDKLEDYLGSNA